MHHPTDRIAYITAFVTPVVEHWLERHQLWSMDRNNKELNGYMVSHYLNQCCNCNNKARRKRFYLTTHSTHFNFDSDTFVIATLTHCCGRTSSRCCSTVTSSDWRSATSWCGRGCSSASGGATRCATGPARPSRHSTRSSPRGARLQAGAGNFHSWK